MLLAEQLVGEARQRRPRRMTAREQMVSGLSAACLVAVAVGMLLALPDQRNTGVIELAWLVIGYAAISGSGSSWATST